jgi:hypothetical protein
MNSHRPLLLTIVIVSMFCVILSAFARDPDGRYAQEDPATHNWFQQLASKKGLCCAFADGTAISDVDWDTKDGHYRVRIEGSWYDVPDDAVITEPNRIGKTMVWPYHTRELDGKEGYGIRCFLRGSMI